MVVALLQRVLPVRVFSLTGRRFLSSSASAFDYGSDQLFKVSGKSVVVTGGAQGIGQVLASGFASRGCFLFILDLDKTKAEKCAADLEAAHPQCLGAQGLACDVREESQVQAAAEAVAKSLELKNQSLDVLINCAGITRRMPAEEFTMTDFDSIVGTNTRGTWCATMQFGNLMLNSGRGGCIINIDSFVTASNLKHVLPYAVSKAGVQSLTKGLALEWGPRGIRVNGLAPGLILTPISQALWSQAHMQSWAMDQTPLARMGSTDDLVGAAIFLASPAAQFISGQTIRVDGGLSAGRHWPIDANPSSAASNSPAQASSTGSAASNSPAQASSTGMGKQGSVRSFATASGHGGLATVAACADLNFYTGKPFVANPFVDDGVDVNMEAGVVSASNINVLNGRCEAELLEDSGASLARRGFSLQAHVSKVIDFRNDADCREQYYAELCEEAKRLTGADHVKVVSHVVRQVGEREDKPQGASVRKGAFFVHGDFCDTLKGQFLEMLQEGKPNALGDGGLNLSAEELSAGRLVVLNFWRPLCKEPLRRAPLAVCDASSMQSKDLHTYAHDPKPAPKHYSLPLPNLLVVSETSSQHRWYSFPGMTRDECLVFKTYDSMGSMPSNGVGVHSAFEDPMDIEGIRESIEARVLCFIGKDKYSGAKWQRGESELDSKKPAMENIERIRFYKWLEDAEGWDGAVGLTAKFTIPKEKQDIFLDIMRENIANTRLEKGMLQYDLVPDYDPSLAKEKSNAVFWLLERFRSRADLLAHVESDHYKRCQERFSEDMGGHPLVQIGLYRIDPVEP